MSSAPRFARWIGIDFSGAKGPRLPGLQVAEWDAKAGAPALLQNAEDRRAWTRSALLRWLIGLGHGPERSVVGMDFAFAPAFADHGAYLPGAQGSPRDASSWWEAVEEQCRAAAELYAGPLYLDLKHPWAPWLCTPRSTGQHWVNRPRETDRRLAKKVRGATPSDALHFVGPGAVGSASAAGWRLLHSLRKHLGERVAIWPFDPVARARLVLVELFPRFAWLAAAGDPRAWDDPNSRAALREAYDLDRRAASRFEPRNEDEADAWAACAAVHTWSSRATLWSRARLPSTAITHEGWLFGL